MSFSSAMARPLAIPPHDPLAAPRGCVEAWGPVHRFAPHLPITQVHEVDAQVGHPIRIRDLPLTHPEIALTTDPRQGAARCGDVPILGARHARDARRGRAA